MADPIAPSTKAAVLKWMAKHDAGYKRAATHFGLNLYTVRNWTKPKPANPRPRGRPPRDRQETPGIHASTTRIDEGSSVGAGEAVREVDYTPPPAVDPHVREKADQPPKPVHPLASPKPPARTAALFPINDREDMRGAVRRFLAFLNSQAAVDDCKRAADASRALQTLIAVCPDILTFEDRTSGADKSATANAEAENLASVFGVGK